MSQVSNEDFCAPACIEAKHSNKLKELLSHLQVVSGASPSSLHGTACSRTGRLVERTWVTDGHKGPVLPQLRVFVISISLHSCSSWWSGGDFATLLDEQKPKVQPTGFACRLASRRVHLLPSQSISLLGLKRRILVVRQ